jgi:hypothetical protein
MAAPPAFKCGRRGTQGPRGPAVAFLGDSHVQGGIGGCFVDMLQRKLDIDLVNAGRNGEMVHGVAARVEGLLVDGIHLNDTGAQLLASLLEPLLEPLQRG